MDESGQATEPEMLIPLANLSGPKEQKGVQVIMAGDIKQLGSVLRSPIAIKVSAVSATPTYGYTLTIRSLHL